MDDAQLPKKTFTVRLTKMELLHLRDLFSVLMPSEMRETVSQKLAQSQQRALLEARLWQKLARTCAEAELPMEEDAPDFVVIASPAPNNGVFELAREPSGPPVEEEAPPHDDWLQRAAKTGQE